VARNGKVNTPDREALKNEGALKTGTPKRMQPGVREEKKKRGGGDQSGGGKRGKKSPKGNVYKKNQVYGLSPLTLKVRSVVGQI